MLHGVAIDDVAGKGTATINARGSVEGHVAGDCGDVHEAGVAKIDVRGIFDRAPAQVSCDRQREWKSVHIDEAPVHVKCTIECKR